MAFTDLNSCRNDITGDPAPALAQADLALAVLFFENFSQEHPGMFPSVVTQTGTDGKPQTSIQSVKEDSDIQSTFFDMWRQEHPEATFKRFQVIW